MTDYEIHPTRPFNLGLKELWHYRELFYFFTWRDIKVKYKQTFLGFTWVILQPLLLMFLFSFFFGVKLKVPSDTLPYPVFVFAGLLLWNIFASGLATAGNSMINNANIIKKIYFPRLIIPLSAVLVSIFDFLISISIYIIILIIYQISVNVFVMAGSLILAVIMTSITTFGLGTFLAALNVKYRDFRYLIPFLIQVLLFVSPVIYSVSIVKTELIRYVLALNPMSGAITLFRASVAGTGFDWDIILIGLAVSVFIFVSGVFYFRRAEAVFADIA